MGSLFSEPKAAVATAMTPTAPAAPAATLVTEPPKKAGDRAMQRKRGSRAASILTTDVDDSRLGG